MFDSGSQWSNYKNPAVDATLQTGRSTLDQAIRTAAYHDALTIIHEEIPAVPLYQDAVMYVARSALQFAPTASESFFLFDMAWQ